MSRNRDPHTIILRTGSGVEKAAVPVKHKYRVGMRTTHNGDGRSLRAVALGVDGVAYETKSRGGGWRVAINQQQTIDQIQRLRAASIAEQEAR